MSTFELTAEETTAVLRWVPHLEADRKQVFGSPPSARMTIHFFDDDNIHVALAQLAIVSRALCALGREPPFNTRGLPPIVARDLKWIGRAMLKLAGKSRDEIDALDQQAQELGTQLAIERVTETLI